MNLLHNELLDKIVSVQPLAIYLLFIKFACGGYLYSILRSIVRFNHGSEILMQGIGNWTPESLKIRNKLDKKRVRDSIRKENKIGEEREKKIRKIQEEEAKKREEGETYGPGIAPV